MAIPEVQQAYSALADRYIEAFGSGEHEHPDDLQLMSRHLAGVRGLVLDLGCGPGHLSGYLAALGADVLGIDLVPEFVEHARNHHQGPRFEVGTLMSLSQAEGSVAGVLAWYSLIHLEACDLTRAFAQVRRVLAPGGVLVLGFFDGVKVEAFDHKVVTAFRWPVDELARHLAVEGFQEVERLQRPPVGDRRPHGALAVRAT